MGTYYERYQRHSKSLEIVLKLSIVLIPLYVKLILSKSAVWLIAIIIRIQHSSIGPCLFKSREKKIFVV